MEKIFKYAWGALMAVSVALVFWAVFTTPEDPTTANATAVGMSLYWGYALLAVAVVADLVAFLKDPPGDIGIIPHPVTAQQKGCLHTPVVKTVQKGPGIFTGRAVIKGQRHITAAVCRPGRQGKQGKSHEQKEKTAHGIRSFLDSHLTEGKK